MLFYRNIEGFGDCLIPYFANKDKADGIQYGIMTDVERTWEHILVAECILPG